MVFSSHLFVYYFLPLALLVYYLLPRRLKHLGLTLLSYLFYGWANPAFMVLMLTSTVIDYFCGLAITQRLGPRWREPIERLEKGGPRTRSQRVAVAVSVLPASSLTVSVTVLGPTSAQSNEVTSSARPTVAVQLSVLALSMSAAVIVAEPLASS